MDRTSFIGVIVCLILLIGLEFGMEKKYPTLPPKPKPAPVATTSPANAAANATATPNANPPSLTSGTPTEPAMPAPPADEQIYSLENDEIKLTLTSIGAAVKEIQLKHHANGADWVKLNQRARSNVLQLEGWDGVSTLNFAVTSDTPGEKTFVAVLPDGIKWQRSYTLGKDYTVAVKDSLTNPGASETVLPSFSLSVGRAEPLLVGGHYQETSNLYLGSGWLTDKFHLTTVSDFNSYSWLGLYKSRDARTRFSSKDSDPEPLRWLGVENQFFTVLLTPAVDKSIQHAEFVCYNPRDASGNVERRRNAEGQLISQDVPDIEAAAWFPEIRIPAGQTVEQYYQLYTGPKEYGRLNDLGRAQGELMNYGMFFILIVPMLTVLHLFHSLLGSYGVAIILLTLIIKAFTWPLVSISNRTGKRMQALAPMIKEMQAKYKDQPEKLQSETWSLYRDYGVNPLGGCLPVLIQMPVFFSLYFMLQNAVELRGQSFLWVHDLTQPDTIWSTVIGGMHLTLNPLPLMVTGLTMVMMRLTPQIGDPQQAKIAQWMPLVFLFFFYNFAAALSLYYVINNCVSIIQIYRNLKKPLPELKRLPKKK